MATTADTSDRDNSHGRTTELEQQLDRLLENFEQTDWHDVDGITVAEAAALGEKLKNARERTARDDGGR